MSTPTQLRTAESVTEGHPDKVADRIADTILDAALESDPTSRIACEALVTEGMVVLAGEVATAAGIDFAATARTAVEEVGYTRAELGFAAGSLGVAVLVGEQSPEIARAVAHAADEAEEEGAGDQGIMFGYATRETPELLPLPIQVAHRLAASLAAARLEQRLGFLRPDGKTQVSVRYVEGRPVEIARVLISAQHEPGIDQDEIRTGLWEQVVLPVLPDGLFDPDSLWRTFLANPTGSFTRGGPAADSGLTGRKTAVDTYGGAARHGGGCLSGKDPSKVDRTGAYAARWVAGNLVAAGLAERCEVEVAYAIGIAAPFSLRIDSFGTGELPDERLAELAREVFDLRPRAVARQLDLQRPIYTPLAAYGHFGRPELDLPWERFDRAGGLAELAGS